MFFFTSTLHSQMQAMDERFRQQLSSTEEMNDLAMNRVKNEAEQLRIACETRVAEVSSLVLKGKIRLRIWEKVRLF